MSIWSNGEKECWIREDSHVEDAPRPLPKKEFGQSVY